MTWVEVLPTIAIIYGLGNLVFFCINNKKCFDYRGLFDKRVPPGDFGNQYNVGGRLGERDIRMAIQPKTIEWIHPEWRPSNYQE